MARHATGELRRLADGFAALITIEGRTRRPFRLQPTTEPEARQRCTALAGMAARLRRAGHVNQIAKIVKMGADARPGRPWDAVLAAVETLCAGPVREKGRGETPLFSAWAKDWTGGELAKKYPDHVKAKRSSYDDETRLRAHILPHVEGVRVDEFSLEHAEFVMANLDAELAPGTRRQIAQIMARLMRLAVYPGKWRKDNPIPAGWLPREGAAKAKECLYPDEDALLMRGVSREAGKPDVPVLRRLAYGFLAREGMRTDEMASLRWRDVDLARGRIHLDVNKTDDPRDWDLRPDVLEALKRWKERQPCTEPGDHVFADNGVPMNVLHLAGLLRRDLRRVGITRPQLFERSAVRQPIRAHDLRATFVTIALATGKTETWISDRTGHHSHKMINAYRRKARTWNQGELGPLFDLVPEISGPATVSAASVPITTSLPQGSTPQPNPQTLNRKCMTGDDPQNSAAIEKTSAIGDPSTPEKRSTRPGKWQSSGSAERGAELEAAIENLTRLIASSDDPETAGELVAERRAMRGELAALRRDPNVIDLGTRRRR